MNSKMFSHIGSTPTSLVCQTNERPFAFDSPIIYDGLLLEPYSTAVSAFISRHKWTPPPNLQLSPYQSEM